MSDAASPRAAGADDPWIHHSPKGVEAGGAEPSGKLPSAPAAFVSGLAVAWQLRKAVWVLVLKDFKGRYRAHALGLFWSLAHPLVMMATMTVAFQYVLRIQIKNFAIFFLIGSIYWQFFANALTTGTTSLLDNGGNVKTTTFPRFLFPVASVLSQLIHFAMESVLIFAFFFFFPSAYKLNVTLIALPPLVFFLVLTLIGLSFITSTLHARYRDVSYIVSSALTVGFWLTPVLYSSSMVPSSMRPIVRLNPVGCVIESARAVIMSGQWPPSEFLLPVVGSALVIFFLGCAVFRRQNVRVADFV
jgi:ABC-type polysaccharide/polyol phosphate export permease